MYPKINVYVNGIYKFSTNKYRTCKEVIEHIRAVKHLQIASFPKDEYLTVYDYDRLRVVYDKERC